MHFIIVNSFARYLLIEDDEDITERIEQLIVKSVDGILAHIARRNTPISAAPSSAVRAAVVSSPISKSVLLYSGAAAPLGLLNWYEYPH